MNDKIANVDVVILLNSKLSFKETSLCIIFFIGFIINLLDIDNNSSFCRL